MELAELIQKFFLLLLPGIAGMLLYHQLNIHEERPMELEVLKLICLSLSSYLAADALFWVLSRFPAFPWGPVNILEEIGAPVLRLPAPNVFAALCAAVGIAFLLTKANDDGWTTAIAERLSAKRRKRKREHEVVWFRILEEGKVVVLRDLVTNRTYYGKIAFYSGQDEIREIYLQDAYVYIYNNRYEYRYHVDALYLSREHNQFVMEIQDPRENPESRIWRKQPEVSRNESGNNERSAGQENREKGREPQGRR